MSSIVVSHEVLPNGLYTLFWKEGGTSEAAIGRDRTGSVWYAPTNWVTVPSYDWDRIKKVVRLCS